MTDIFISAHPAGGNSNLYANATVHATNAAKAAIEGGSTKATTESFIDVFGEAFLRRKNDERTQSTQRMGG
jgi:hypothetical protein